MIKHTGYEIYRTTDYSIFKHLTGNRKTRKPCIERIKASIKDVGPIMNPLVVNENYEVIDGQNRLYAYEDLNLPVYFVIQPGLGIRECIAMNINQSNWKVTDYIVSYAEQGNPNYIRFLHTLNKYKKNAIDLRAITSVLEKGRGEIGNSVIMHGSLTYSDDDKKEAEACLNYISKITDILSEQNIQSFRMYQTTVAWLYFRGDIDKDRLLKKVEKYKSMLCTVGNVEQAATTLEEIYNYKNRDRSYFSAEMKKERDENKREKAARQWKSKTFK